jgi:hypothetical protein
MPEANCTENKAWGFCAHLFDVIGNLRSYELPAVGTDFIFLFGYCTHPRKVPSEVAE